MKMAVEIRDVTRMFGRKTAVDSLKLDIYENELFGLLGINGAGKTTAIRMICGLLEPSEGEINVCGLSVSRGTEKVKAMINLSPQETAVAPNLTVKENLELMGGLYGLSGEALAENVGWAIKEFRLEEVLGDKARNLSGGWQRRLSIAMALVSRPKVLFLDEPTLGLDVIARRELYDTIRSLKNSMTIVLTTHYLEEAEALCDRIGIMSKGIMRAVGAPEELMELAGADNFEDAFVKIAGGEYHEQ